MSSENKSKRRSNAFMAGFATGIAAPALLLSGAFFTVSHRSGSSLNEAWRDVGRSIKVSASAYKQRRGHDGT